MSQIKTTCEKVRETGFSGDIMQYFSTESSVETKISLTLLEVIINSANYT